jgi:hypothetical protein
MKMNNTFFSVKSLIVYLLLLVGGNAFSQVCAGNQVEMSIANISATTNTLEFDVYLKNTGTTTLKLGGCQGNFVSVKDWYPTVRPERSLP